MADLAVVSADGELRNRTRSGSVTVMTFTLTAPAGYDTPTATVLPADYLLAGDLLIAVDGAALPAVRMVEADGELDDAARTGAVAEVLIVRLFPAELAAWDPADVRALAARVVDGDADAAAELVARWEAAGVGL